MRLCLPKQSRHLARCALDASSPPSPLQAPKNRSAASCWGSALEPGAAEGDGGFRTALRGQSRGLGRIEGVCRECGNWSDGDPAGLVGWEVTPASGEDTKPWLCPEVLGEVGAQSALPSWDSICEEVPGAGGASPPAASLTPHCTNLCLQAGWCDPPALPTPCSSSSLCPPKTEP